MLSWLVAALAAPVAVAPTCERVPVALPEGVTATLVARELAKGRPAGVTFALEGSPAVRDGKLVLRGVLANTGPRSATVWLVSAPATCGPLLVSPRGVPFRPAPAPGGAPPTPETLPAPLEVVLPAGARVPYETALTLADWAWVPGAPVTLDWSFQFWGEPVAGEVAGAVRR